MHLIKLSLCLISAIFLSSFSYGTDYYVTYDSTDATTNIQNTIDNAGSGDRIILAFQGQGTKWISGPLTLKDNIEFVLESGVILEGKSGAFSLYTPFIFAKDNSNITVSGYGATIRMLLSEFSDGEWRHGLSFKGCDSITIEGVTIEKSGGDGIYLGSTAAQAYCSNVLIKDVKCDGNARQGISLISGDNIEIKDCELSNTGVYNPSGVASAGPWSGIDIEPNSSIEKVNDVYIHDCDFIDNRRAGIFMQLNNIRQSSGLVDITISRCNTKGGAFGIRGMTRDDTTGYIDINNCFIEDSTYDGFFFLDWSSTIPVDISDTVLLNSTTSTVRGAVLIETDPAIGYCTGNISFTNVDILTHNNTHALELKGANATYPIEDVTGVLYTDSADMEILYTTSYYSNCTVALLLPKFYNEFAGTVDGLGGTDRESFFTNPAAKITTGDFNGDGKTDLFVKGYSTYRALYLANSTGDGFNRAFMSDQDGVAGTDSEDFFTSSDAVIYPGDYNGDGKTDLFLKGYGTYRALYLANSTGDGFVVQFAGDSDGLGGTDSDAFFTSPDALVYPGDYNGDGKTDLFIKGYSSYRALYLANSTGTGFDVQFAGTTDGLGGTDSEGFFVSSDAKITTGDYNGDGKTDLFIKGYGTYRALYLANSSGNGFDRAFMSDQDGVGGTDSDAFFTSSDAVIYPGDYNGDGKTDLFLKGYSNYRALYLANEAGNGFDVQFAGTADGLGGTDNEGFFVNASSQITTGDFNGDGKTDLFLKGYGTYRVLYLANNGGDGFTRAFLGDQDGVGGTDSDDFFVSSDAVIYPGDYNGDGKTDLFLKGYLTYRALYIAGVYY